MTLMREEFAEHVHYAWRTDPTHRGEWRSYEVGNRRAASRYAATRDTIDRRYNVWTV